MKYFLLFWLILFSLFACEEEDKPPFSKEKIQSILMQVHLTDASASTLLGEFKDSVSNVYMDQVKAINKITDEEIESIFIYLKDHPEFAEEVYQNMIKDINQVQTEAKAQRKKERELKEKKEKDKKEVKKPVAKGIK